MANVDLRFDTFEVGLNPIFNDNLFDSGDTIAIDYSIINAELSDPQGETIVEFYLSRDNFIDPGVDFFLGSSSIFPEDFDVIDGTASDAQLITLPTNRSFLANNGSGNYVSGTYFVGGFIDVDPVLDNETFIDDNFTDALQAEVIDIEIINNLPTNDTSPLTLDGTTAQIAYVAYYGRSGDLAGLDFWNDVLTQNGVSYSPTQGDRLTGIELDVYNQIVNQFGNSDEANRLFGGLTVREQVNLVYNLAFDRQAEQGGLDFWVPIVQDGSVSLAAFALEISLGARNQDIITVRNKIESADLFSDSFAGRPDAIDAYRGGFGEEFGRQWLSVFGSSISELSQVDSALTQLELF
ncbi:MAG: DUF4214 domain-containing protein [Prochloraceae cyanobacterium]|nr:DUF4214 domain-containing protein [Prochloraceae cyanobacterium]